MNFYQFKSLLKNFYQFQVTKCDGAKFSTIPRTLSPEVQELVLSNNNIGQLDKEEFKRVREIVNLNKKIL